MPQMIYHAPYPLNPDATSASGIRPVLMRKAFEAIGYEVLEVSGVSGERLRAIREAKRRIRSGERFDFVYSESSTMPAFMTDPDHLPRHPLLDAAFFRFCERRGIRVGLFYRDVQWRFPIYDEGVRWPLSAVMRALYRWELQQYRRAGIDLYLPSFEMAEWVPVFPKSRMRELPPGAVLRDSEGPSSDHSINLLYVGGIGGLYALHETLREIAGRDGVSLTICTREVEWRQRAEEYRDLLAPNISVVHSSGAELEPLYAKADIALLMISPTTYASFAVPMKLFEYIGAGKPVIASAETMAARFVAENGVGWSLRYGSGELGELLDRISRYPQELKAFAARAKEMAPENTWEARARRVVDELSRSRTII